MLQEWQLSKIYGIFRREKLQISPTLISSPASISLNWETVGSQNMSAGRGWGVFMPNTQFVQDIQQYRFNKFLDLGKILRPNNGTSFSNLPIFSGMYPHFLWLFKEYLTELKDQLIFHDHLLNHVEEWKKSIKESNSKGKNCQNFHKWFWSGQWGVTPSPPYPPYGQPDHKRCFFDAIP